MSNHSDLFLSKLTHHCYWDFQIKVNVFNSLLFKVFLVDILYQCKVFFFQLQLWGLVFIVVCLICFRFGYQVLNSGQTPHYWATSNDILSLWKEFPSSLELTFEVQSVLKFIILLSYPLKFLGSQASGVCGWLVGLAQHLNLASSLWPSCFVSSGAMVRGVNPHVRSQMQICIAKPRSGKPNLRCFGIYWHNLNPLKHTQIFFNLF